MKLPVPHSLLLSIVSVLLTLIVTIILNSLLRSYVKVPKKLDNRRGRTYVAVIRSIISVVLFVIALDIIFIVLGINIAPLLASAGIVGLAIGIGARSLIEDLIAGFFLLTQSSIAVGDYVTIGSNAEGIVEDIGFRTITVRGINGALYIIPNGQIKQVINYSQGRAVIFIDLPVKAGQNIDHIMRILKKTLHSFTNEVSPHYHVSSTSQVQGVQNIQPGNCVIIRVLIVTTSSYRETAEREFRYKVIRAFEKNKIQFA
jgi:moderate conductance mechanosensitive channel